MELAAPRQSMRQFRRKDDAEIFRCARHSLQLFVYGGKMTGTMRGSWTDERLDDFAAHTDRRFDLLERRMEEGFDRIDSRFDRIDSRFERVDSRFERIDSRFERIDDRLDAVQRTMAHGVIALSTAIVIGFGGIFGLLAAQL